MIRKFIANMTPGPLKPMAKKIESMVYFTQTMGLSFDKWRRYLSLGGSEKYIYMQKTFYEKKAGNSKYCKTGIVDHVVGVYALHNDWEDYDTYLMKYVDHSFLKKKALDFACGPGRNIVKYNSRFAQVHGCDISAANIKNARKLLIENNIPLPPLYITSGSDIGDVPDDYYDLIFSTIAMQHICVYDIRLNILKHMYKALKSGGRISVQMGFDPDPNFIKLGSAGYYENNYNALTTNSGHDCRIESPNQIKKDLVEKIGFKNFEYWVRPVGPGDNHQNWIFFTAIK